MVVVYFLLFLSNEDVSTWLSYFTAGLQQLVLLALLIWYHLKNRKKGEPERLVVESQKEDTDDESWMEDEEEDESSELTKSSKGKWRGRVWGLLKGRKKKAKKRKAWKKQAKPQDQQYPTMTMSENDEQVAMTESTPLKTNHNSTYV